MERGAGTGSLSCSVFLLIGLGFLILVLGRGLQQLLSDFLLWDSTEVNCYLLEHMNWRGWRHLISRLCPRSITDYGVDW
jgi:hypothetical protein